MKRWLPPLLFLTTFTTLHAADEAKIATPAAEKQRRLSAKQVFDFQQPIIFQADFASGLLDRFELSEDARYRIDQENPDLIKVVDAPGLPAGRKGVRFVVPRAPNSFRAEISLPFEKGFNERWYSERILVPDDWIFDPGKGNDIVMQWHAIPGNGKPTYPNLEISVGNDRWFIRQSFGDAHTKPTRTNQKLEKEVKRGAWISWVIHARWSPNADGLLEIWQDGTQVINVKGPNVYANIDAEYTPYLKTGIYHPEWNLNTDRKREAFIQENPVATRKVIYATDIKVGNERANLESMTPKP